ncbi:flagellar basal-body rod protein FlgG [Rubinisphaera sp.]|uniref:flagellar basal-body rod protein FlgG n=1 Tax=Rubinisphaera sp. TaxID=2024857 RepID=UPI000C118D59|nr:flagellar basal-body rod protein FlgG [Rubinisphaera sp.]MBV10619.1 flagellar basal-body rod protein FlgG [Rubinisphaera sp.]HCS52338.1 flagellar basal-body rod protein FlgG [Planctomycetaceae bacterium]
MSLRTMNTSATGMEANLFQLDVIANNLANAGTTGFKRSRAEFEDLFYEHFKLPGVVSPETGTETPTGVALGLGTNIRATQVDFRQGSPNLTNGTFDFMIEGEGFFQVVDSGGAIAYTRAGTFTPNSSGDLVMTSANLGRLLEPNINIPANAQNVSVGADGQVSYRENGNSTITIAGQISLARFINPEGLIQAGENLYYASDASGAPTQGFPGTEAFGTILQGALESSNVEPVKELVDLIKTQRNVELNSEALKAGDQMLQLVNNLRRF